MLVSPVVVANPSVDTMGNLSEKSAQIYLMKSSISVMEGPEGVDHLNNILSTNLVSLREGMRMDGLICDSNGKVADVVNCYNMGQSILIIGMGSNTASTRELLTRGIPWDKKLSLLDGNGALEHLKIIGQDSRSLVENIYPELSELSENTFSEFENVLFSISTHNEHEIVDIIVRRDNSDFYGRIEMCNHKISKTEEEINDRLQSVYSNLDPWQTTMVARHEDRPKSKFFIDNLFDDFITLSGDRYYCLLYTSPSPRDS